MFICGCKDTDAPILFCLLILELLLFLQVTLSKEPQSKDQNNGAGVCMFDCLLISIAYNGLHVLQDSKHPGTYI